jgi:hypothetical protein
MLSVVNNDEAGAEGRFSLDEICREGAVHCGSFSETGSTT